MRNKAFLALLAMGFALMLPMMAAADEPEPLVLTLTGQGYYEHVTEYEWQVDSGVKAAGYDITTVDLTVGGQILLDYDLVVTRADKDVRYVYGFRGDVTVDNNTVAALTDQTLLLQHLTRVDEDEWLPTTYSVELNVDLDESDTFLYDMAININDFPPISGSVRSFKVVGQIVLDEVTYTGEVEGLSIPDDDTDVFLNQVAVLDAEFIWLQAGNTVDMPTGITLLTYPSAQSWILETENLTDGTVSLELLALLGTEAFVGSAGTHNYSLRLNVAVTPSNEEMVLADTLSLPVSITVPSEGNHSAHFSVSGGNGLLTAWMGSSELANGASIPAGSQVTFVATATDGYKVKQWKINGTVQPGTGSTLIIPALAANTAVVVEFEPLIIAAANAELEENPAAPALANMILKQHNIPHRIATTTLHRNGKATYINLISEVARQNRGNSFMGVERSDQAAFYSAVYNYLKQLGAQLP